MTAQIPEQIQINGETQSLFSNPLGDFFAERGIKPPFEASSTALWRGYVGHWEITDGQLYLTSINACLRDGTELSLQAVFPEATGRVFANWYSGTLRIPQGDRLKYVHGGYASTYEKDFLIDVERGIVTGTRIRENNAEIDDDYDDEE